MSNLLTEFRELLAAIPSDSDAAGRAYKVRARKEFNLRVTEFEQKLADLISEHAQYVADEYNEQQSRAYE